MVKVGRKKSKRKLDTLFVICDWKKLVIVICDHFGADIKKIRITDSLNEMCADIGLKENNNFICYDFHKEERF